MNNRFSQNVLITPKKRSDPGGQARDGNEIMKNPGFEDRDRPEDESPDPPGEVRSNAVYEDRFFGRFRAGPAEPSVREDCTPLRTWIF